MKNVSMILNVVLIAALIYAGCKPNQGTENKDNNQNGKPGTTAQTGGCDNVCMDFSNNSDLTVIKGSDLFNMAESFKRSNGNPVVTSHDTVPDANSVWFSLNDLKRFIWNIEKNVCQSNCTDSLELGVRIYYARYPATGRYATDQQGPFAELRDDYEKMHTVFMVPTFTTNDSIHNDFYINNAFAGCLPERIVNPDSDEPIGVLIPAGKNHGELCPPLCHGNAF